MDDSWYTSAPCSILDELFVSTGCSLLLASVLCKSMRVAKVFMGDQFAKKVFTTADTVKFVLFFVALDLVIAVVKAALDYPIRTELITYNNTKYQTCRSDWKYWSFLYLIPKLKERGQSRRSVSKGGSSTRIAPEDT